MGLHFTKVTNRLEDTAKERENDTDISNLTSSLFTTGDEGIKSDSVHNLKRCLKR